MPYFRAYRGCDPPTQSDIGLRCRMRLTFNDVVCGLWLSVKGENKAVTMTLSEGTE